MPYKQKTPKNFLICYDISCKRRLAKVYRLISSHAIPIQRSVYFATLRAAYMDAIIARLKIIITKEDDVKIYETESLENAHIQGNRSPNIQLFGENGGQIMW